MAPFHPTAQEIPFYLFFQTSPPPIHYRSGFVKSQVRLLTTAAVSGSQLFLSHSHLKCHPVPINLHPPVYLKLHEWSTHSQTLPSFDSHGFLMQFHSGEMWSAPASVAQSFIPTLKCGRSRWAGRCQWWCNAHSAPDEPFGMTSSSSNPGYEVI